MSKHGQSAAKPLSDNTYEEGSTTISWEESTTLKQLETVYIGIYNLKDSLPKYSGIYGIYCFKNDKIYIGSTLNLCNRKRRHYYDLRKNQHHNEYLQKAWNKYSENSFVFIIIEKIDNMLTQTEEKWINQLDSWKNGFNGTNNCNTYKKYKLSEEQIAKAVNHNSIPVVCLNLKGEFICEYKSVSEAARSVKDQPTNISGCCKGRFRFIKNFIFVYKSEYNPEKSYKLVKREYNFSIEHRKNLSKALKNKTYSENALKNIQKAIIKRCGKPIIKCDEHSNIIKRYDTITECCADNNIYNKTLHKYIKTQTPFKSSLYKYDEDIV